MKELKGIIHLDEAGKSLLEKCKKKSRNERKPDTGQYKTAAMYFHEFEDGYKAHILASVSKKDYYVSAAIIKRADAEVMDALVLFPRETLLGEYVFERVDAKYIVEITE